MFNREPVFGDFVKRDNPGPFRKEIGKVLDVYTNSVDQSRMVIVRVGPGLHEINTVGVEDIHVVDVEAPNWLL